MKKFFNSIVAGLKTKRVAQAKSALDGSDYISLRPEGPTAADIRAVVTERLFKGQPPPSSEAESLQRDASINSLVFDLTFRCCGGGRCIKNDIPCRFPSCFSMRPLSKGAEIKDVRALYEIKTDNMPDINPIIELAAVDQNVSLAAQKIRELCSRKIRIAAYGRRLDDDLVSVHASDHVENPDTFRGPATQPKVNPLEESEELREEIVSLYLWRAALLVNARNDVSAVNSLLNTARLLPMKFRTRCLVAAAQWAFYSDKEVIFYRSFLQRYPSTELAEHMANNRSMTLRRVMEELERSEDTFFFDTALEMIVAKEVLCIVTSAQAAQINGDESEDPMKTAQIPLTLHYFRFHVTTRFWTSYLNRLLLPPMPEPEGSETDPGRDAGLTPRHILDAMGRSMILHHLLKLAQMRDADILSGKVSEGMETKKLVHNITAEELVTQGLDPRDSRVPAGPDEYARYLESGEMQHARIRLRQLLELVRSYETQQAALSGNGQYNLLGLRSPAPRGGAKGPAPKDPAAAVDAGKQEEPPTKQ